MIIHSFKIYFIVSIFYFIIRQVFSVDITKLKDNYLNDLFYNNALFLNIYILQYKKAVLTFAVLKSSLSLKHSFPTRTIRNSRSSIVI